MPLSVNWFTVSLHRTLAATLVRCFYHQNREAIGSCKSCGKGLCPECAVDYTKGLACRRACEADVQALIRLIDQNVRQMDTVQQTVDRNAAAFKQGASNAFFRLPSALFSRFLARRTCRGFELIFVVGLLFLGFGIYRIMLLRRLRLTASPKPAAEKVSQ